MKKMVSLFCLTLIVLFSMTSVSMAISYGLDFDADGTGAFESAKTIYGWDLEAVALETVNGGLYDMVTYQNLGADGILNDGDTFAEDVTLQVLNGLGAPPTYAAVTASGWYSVNAFLNNMPALYAAFTLFGDISNYDNGVDGMDTTLANLPGLADDSYTANFTSGSGTMFADLNGDQIFNAGDIDIAGFSLLIGDSFELDPTVFSGGSSVITLAFKFDYVNSDYFDAVVLQDLIDKSWLLTLAQGSIAVGDGASIGASPPNDILIGFQETGFDAKFQVIPEPSTILLLGLGLVGLVSLGARRRSSK